jgi:A/G-specific adenine glycosylase
MANIKITEILKWYELNKRILPWRKPGISPYSVWVSEIMLQQTQVSRGIIFYERFLKKFPNIKKLAKADWEEFLPYYEGLGYYNRGRNMLKTAKIIVRDFGGEFPTDKMTLMNLPGIGEYSASAILSFAHDLPYVAFDTNFKKIFGTREVAGRAFKKSGVLSSVFNSAVMDYASAHREIADRGQSLRRSGSQTATGKGLSSGSNFGTGTLVILHENHKKYFSENPKKYKPFTMPVGVKTREQVKKYFLEKYGLRLSVRPPKGNIVNAQILYGKHHLKSFTKEEIKM